ncbi:MAG: beta-galactosidase [Candidatus Methylacidiphilales bacterium]|nr:beta-galactosidase [Candidatus Methylacidiphilales bacterium]
MTIPLPRRRSGLCALLLITATCGAPMGRNLPALEVLPGAARASSRNPTLSVRDLLAPARTLSDVTLKGPELLHWAHSGKKGFRLSGELADKRATVQLLPASGFWDVSKFSYVRIDFVNKGPGLVWINGRLDNADAIDWANSTPSQAFVMPGERATLGFPFPRAKALNDAPSIYDQQSGKPNGHREHWKAFDPSKIIACRLGIQSTSPTLVLEDVVISLAHPYGAKANAALLELPYLDAFGQVRKQEWPGKLHHETELKQREEAERVAAQNDHGPLSFNKYGGWAEGPKRRASGFFRVEKVDGKWWIIDPEGRLFFSHGANSVGFDQTTPIAGRESLFAWLPDAVDALMAGVMRKDRMHFMEANLARTFGPAWPEPARDRVHRRLRQWGMNTIGAWSDSGLMAEKRTAFTPILHVGQEGAPLGNKISDPFAKDFKARVVEGLRRLMPDPGNPWCLGVFIDNEIYWTEPFVQNAFLRGEKQPARNACIDWLKKKHGTIEKLNLAWGTTYMAWEQIGPLPDPMTESLKADLSEMKRLISGTYYRLCREAMREALPNHLYLGSRQHKGDPEVYQESAKYVDILSLNNYAALSGSKVPPGVDVPCLDTEFHFGAPDRGVPGVGLWPVGDQIQRSRSYVAYVLAGIKHPNMVGTHWFAFPDQSAAGRPGENYQIGFVDVTDTPYPEITRASRAMAERMYAIGADKSSSLLESLEALWRNEDGAATTGNLPYRIEKNESLAVTPGKGVQAVTGKGPFQMVLTPADTGVWNMQSVRVLGLMVKNTGRTDLILDVMVRNDGATTFSHSALGRTVVKAGESLPLGVALQRLADYRSKHPAYLRMSGRPNGFFRHWHTFDPTSVKDLLITCPSPGEHAFELGSLFPLQKTDERLNELLPVVDRYGQYVHGTWPGKAASDADISARAKEEEALVRELGPAHGFNKYGGWASGPQLKATGFFRTEKMDGKWWFVDPEGKLFWSFGVNCVGADFAGQTPTERDPAVFQDLPPASDPRFGRFHVKLEVEENFLAKPDVPHFDFTRANLFRKYGNNWAEKQIEQDIRRLQYTHLNTIGAWSDTAMTARRKVPYVAMVHYVYPEAAPKLPDPFDPKTRLGLRKALAAYPVKFADDPWCLGAFVDNELHWKNDARLLIGAIFGHTNTGTEARKVFINWLRKKYGAIEALNKGWKMKLSKWDDLLDTTDPLLFSGADTGDCSALAALFSDTLFRLVREELSTYSPNVLYLGCRMNAGSPEVIAALARHADVISANIYSYRPELKQYGATDKPVLISEFHFVNVSGNNLGGGLRSAQDAVQQGRLLMVYMAEAVQDPKLVGAHWFQWRDQSAAGRYDGENFNVGLYDVIDGANVDLVRAMASCGRSLYPGK